MAAHDQVNGESRPGESRLSALGHRLHLSPKEIASSAGIVVVAAAILYAIHWALGTPAALAAYFAVLLLLAPALKLPLTPRIIAGVWAFAIAIIGYIVGEHRGDKHGLALLAVVLVLVCLAQSMFSFGQVAALTRSPVNLIVFASMAHNTEAQLWHVAVGTALGIILVFAVGHLLRRSSSDTPPRIAVVPLTMSDRLRQGILLAGGCVIIVLVAELVPGVPRVQWALLAFCMILAVDAPSRGSRMRERIWGTMIGAVVATLAATLLPSPIPYVLAALCGVLCLAYIRVGDYTLFVVFLTPAVLLTTSGKAPWSLALEQIEAVLAAVVLALVVTMIGAALAKRTTPRFVTAPPPSGHAGH